MKRFLFLSAFLCFVAVPSTTHAAAKTPTKKVVQSPIEISGWIPYWREATGTADTLAHIQNMSAVMPFGYVVQNDGSLHDAFDFSDTSSTSTANTLLAAAKANKVKIVPTAMWSNGAAISAILSSASSRQALEENLVTLVKENNFDGINIDFENKSADSRPYFSLFLKGLYTRMGQKLVYCSIEPRTPPSSAFAVVPDTLDYANDYVAINKYCDRVQLMTYDQGAEDLQLNAAANFKPYIPIADPKWVEKVVNLAAKTISKKKLVIGVATYGYEYDLVPLQQGYRYNINWAFDPRYATDLATQLGLTATRNMADELSFVYQATSTPALAGAAAAFPPLRIAWWSDATAIKDKITLARKLGVAGIAIFKLDGGEDPNLWSILPPAKK